MTISYDERTQSAFVLLFFRFFHWRGLLDFLVHGHDLVSGTLRLLLLFLPGIHRFELEHHDAKLLVIGLSSEEVDTYEHARLEVVNISHSLEHGL